MVRTGSCTQSARHRVDHGTTCGRGCANWEHCKPLCACVDRTKFIAPASVAGPHSVEGCDHFSHDSDDDDFSVSFRFAASFFSAFNQNLLSLALTSIAWRQLFNFIGLFGIGLFILGALFIRNPTPIVRPAEGFAAFLAAVAKSIVQVAKIPHIWVSSAFGALCFGVMLGLGVVWAPKLLGARGFDAATANWSPSLLWLGLAAGCLVVPRWSEMIKRRKLPIIVGVVVQIVALLLLLYLPELNSIAAMVLCFAFGVGNAAHMLAFSTAADVVRRSQIGTSATIVNGIMFIVGGIMISRPGRPTPGRSRQSI